jgi:hypothetical protein
LLIRVASVPAAHPYVAGVTDPDHIALLPDPTPPNATVAGQWWPPRWLEPAYLASRIGEIDVLHVHFGFDSTPPQTLVEVCGVLAAHRVPLVVTVHDLLNPHLVDQAAHRARLEVLVRGASTVITLTGGAARAIADRWHRQSVVLPHPHLLPIDAVGVARHPRSAPVIGVHAKHLRANVDPWPIVDALTARRGGLSVRLDLDDNAMSSPRADASLPDRLARYAVSGVDVRVHPPFTEAELVGYLHAIDVMVLPYRFGTHSGWVEACHDAGVATVVPTCGFFDEQQPSHTYGFGRAGLDEPSLTRAVDGALARVRESSGSVDGARRTRRKAQRETVRHELVRIYRRLLVEKNAA